MPAPFAARRHPIAAFVLAICSWALLGSLRPASAGPPASGDHQLVRAESWYLLGQHTAGDLHAFEASVEAYERALQSGDGSGRPAMRMCSSAPVGEYSRPTRRVAARRTPSATW